LDVRLAAEDSSLYELDLKRNGHFVADQSATGRKQRRCWFPD
jgi:hypothetical protein